MQVSVSVAWWTLHCSPLFFRKIVENRDRRLGVTGGHLEWVSNPLRGLGQLSSHGHPLGSYKTKMATAVPISARSWRSYENIGDSEQSSSMVMCGLNWGTSFLTTSPVSFPPPPPWKLGPRGKHSLFSSQEPVVSWSRGSLQIKPSGSGDENGVSSSPITLLNTKNPIFSGKLCEKSYFFSPSTKLPLSKFIYSARFKNKMFYI